MEDVRAAASEAHPAEHGVHLTIDTPGNMSTWYWRHNEPPKAGNVKIHVAYGAGLCIHTACMPCWPSAPLLWWQTC